MASRHLREELGIHVIVGLEREVGNDDSKSLVKRLVIRFERQSGGYG